MLTLKFTAPPANAADGFTPYTNLILWTGWTHKSAELGEGLLLLDEVGKTVHERINYQQDVAATAFSNIGMRWEKDSLSMKAEIGVSPFTQKGSPSLTVRYFYCAYHFGPVELRGGYDLAPYCALNRNDVCDGEALADAGIFDSFQPQLRLSVGGAYVQIMHNVINNSDLYLDSNLVGIGVLTTTGNTKSILPKTALGYLYTTSHMSIGLHYIFQTYSINEPKSGQLNGKAITATVGSISMKGEFGPFSMNLSGFIGQNPGELGIFTNNNKNGNYIPFNGAANNKAKTDTAFQFWNTYGKGFSASGGLKVGFCQLNAGIAYDMDQNKVFKTKLFPSDIDDSYAAFANCIFFIRPNLKLAPAVKIINYNKSPGNFFLLHDESSQPIMPDPKEGVLIKYGFALQASL